MKRTIIGLIVVGLVALGLLAPVAAEEQTEPDATLQGVSSGHWENGNTVWIHSAIVNHECDPGTKPAVRVTDHSTWAPRTLHDIVEARLVVSFMNADGSTGPTKYRTAEERPIPYSEYYEYSWESFNPKSGSNQPFSNMKLVGPTGGSVKHLIAAIQHEDNYPPVYYRVKWFCQ